MTALPQRWALRLRAAEGVPIGRARLGVQRIALAIAVIACFLPRLGFLARPFESDAGLYAYLGKVVATGGVYGELYRDFYETKGPGVALFTGAIWKLLGDYWPAWVALQMFMVWGTAMALRAVARQAWGAGAGTAAFWFTLVFLNFGPVAYRGFQLETVVAFFAGLAAFAGWRSFSLQNSSSTIPPIEVSRIAASGLPALMMGLCAGMAAMIKPTGGAVFGAFAVLWIFQQQWRTLGVACAGFMLPVIAVAAWTWRAGLLSEMPGLWREISLYGSQTPLPAGELLIKAATMIMICGFVLYAVWRLGRGGVIETAIRTAPLLFNRISAPVFFALAWLGLECFGVYVQKRMYAYHFLPIAAPLALLFGRLIAGRAVRPIGLLAALTPVVALSLFWSRADFATLCTTGAGPLPESKYLLSHASPADRVVGDGIERLLMETRLRSGTRYAHLFYLANHDAAPVEYGARFLADLEKNSPEWAVFESPVQWRLHRELSVREMPLFAERPARGEAYLKAGEEIQRYIESHYTAQAQVAGKTIWRRSAAPLNQ